MIDLAVLMRDFRAYVGAQYPSHVIAECAFRERPGEVRLVISFVASAQPDVTFGVTSSESEQPDDADPRAVEADILQAVSEYDGTEPLTGQRLAPLAGYEYGAWFKTALARLVKSGRLQNDRPGYSIPAG